MKNSWQLPLLLLQHVPKDQNNQDPVGRPIMHRSAISQATGEAVYCDDIPRTDGELFLALVTSSRAHAKITWVTIRVDWLTVSSSYFKCVFCPPGGWMWARLCSFLVSSTSSQPKIFLGRKSVRCLDMTRSSSLRHRWSRNLWLSCLISANSGFTSTDLCLQVSCIGQMLCAVVADTRVHARRGAAAVKISYEDLPDPVFTTEVCTVWFNVKWQKWLPFVFSE